MIIFLICTEHINTFLPETLAEIKDQGNIGFWEELCIHQRLLNQRVDLLGIGLKRGKLHITQFWQKIDLNKPFL